MASVTEILIGLATEDDTKAPIHTRTREGVGDARPL